MVLASWLLSRALVGLGRGEELLVGMLRARTALLGGDGRGADGGVDPLGRLTGFHQPSIFTNTRVYNNVHLWHTSKILRCTGAQMCGTPAQGSKVHFWHKSLRWRVSVYRPPSCRACV